METLPFADLVLLELMHRTAIAVLALFLLSTGSIRAQGLLRPVPAGERARIHTGSLALDPLIGRVVAWDSAGVTLTYGTAGASLWLPVSQIRMLEVSDGRPRLAWGVIGAGTGLLGGVLLGSALGHAAEPTGWGGMIGMTMGVVVGPVVGGVVGVAVAPEEWEIWALPRRDGATELATTPARIGLPVGADVRLEPVGGARVRGSVAGQDPESFTIRGRGEGVTSTHRWSDIQRLEIRGGRDRRRGAALGALVLGGVAVVFGGIDAAQGEISGGELAEGIAWNTVIGAGLGWVFAPAGWVRVPRLQE